MTADLSRLLNALGLVAVDTVLVLAFVDQLWFRDLPCPICILQRAGFIAAGFGIALNLIFGPRPSHYGLAILGAMVGGIMSADQVLHYVVPGTGSYGNAIFGLHLYTWALIGFALIVVGSAVMLLFDRQYEPTGPLPLRLTVLPLTAVALLALIAVANVMSTLAICGFGLCPETPGGYLIFNENLRLAVGKIS
ncbi:MAG TPA: disulfide bond formation protein B [Methyloceanibacter sp.]